MKTALPKTAKIAKDAKETVQECVSEFISFITSEACDKCKSEKRKTINGDDLLFAMNTLGFENYFDILHTYLQKYRKANKIPQKEREQQKKEKQAEKVIEKEEQKEEESKEQEQEKVLEEPKIMENPK